MIAKKTPRFHTSSGTLEKVVKHRSTEGRVVTKDRRFVALSFHPAKACSLLKAKARVFTVDLPCLVLAISIWKEIVYTWILYLQGRSTSGLQ
uniref:Uncharacterized protein n=1 Tax=Nelumbo nucifera TaxID=4432 RepID=A0A822YLI4_NELNU|nr:TPA_asm: hypothetical protein HUJ06_012243 [Nelumbo nucifera]